MTDIGKYVEELMAAGCVPKIAARVVAEAFAAGVRSGPFRDETAEKRRAYDRDRKAKKRKSADAGGIPVEREPVHTLWTEGVGLLRQLGEAEKSARSNIGRWLKKNEPGEVMAAIKRAHENRAGDPVPWITMALGGKNGKRTLSQAADDLIARAEECERETGSG